MLLVSQFGFFKIKLFYFDLASQDTSRLNIALNKAEGEIEALKRALRDAQQETHDLRMEVGEGCYFVSKTRYVDLVIIH